MSFIAIFSASHCGAELVAQRVADELGYELVAPRVLADAAAKHAVTPERLRQTMEGPASIVEVFRRDRRRNVAYVREALAERVAQGQAVYLGFGTHLLPKTVSHVLKIGLVAARAWRIQEAMRLHGLTERKARKTIDADDEQRLQWTQYLHDLGPWDERLYDEMIPMHNTSVDEAVRLVVENARRSIVAPNVQSQAAGEDFVLAARVGVALAKAGLDADVEASVGNVVMVINKYVMRVQHLEAELKRVASSVPGVLAAATRLGPKFRPPAIHRDLDLPGPRRILLVDDEKEFVHTLSERLEARDLGAAVAYNGEDALSFVESQAPEVMVLDLKMPGIDGIEVLRRLRRSHPEVEVIILTGHGSEREQAQADELGAFAYLHKPVDIEVLAKTMRDAYRRAHERKAMADDQQPHDGEADDGEVDDGA